LHRETFILAAADMCKALVLSAGGMFGAYQAGAWEALAENFQPDIVVGASIGCLNGWAIAGGCDPAELSSRWLRLHDIGMHRWRMPANVLDGFLDATRMHAWIRDLHASYEPRISYGVVLTDALRMKPRLFTSPGVTWEHLAGSCAIFGVLPQMRIQGRYYTDGGLLEALPVWAARQMGATDIIGINVLPRLPGSVLQGSLQLFRRIAPKPPQLPADSRVRLLQPATALGNLRESIHWNGSNARKWIEAGRTDAAVLASTCGPGTDD
jgi:predicted acylesterase/phospholipase RssA